METFLAPDVFKSMRNLSENPQPLIEALKRYPYTLIHGDYAARNLAHLKPDHPVAFDWQGAGPSLMIFDLVHFTDNVHVSMGKEQAISYYRRRLEGYLNERFDDTAWRAMIDRGNLFEAIIISCFHAYLSKLIDKPERQAFFEMDVKRRNQQVRDGMRWL